jgi:hypothetical protein
LLVGLLGSFSTSSLHGFGNVVGGVLYSCEFVAGLG